MFSISFLILILVLTVVLVLIVALWFVLTYLRNIEMVRYLRIHFIAPHDLERIEYRRKPRALSTRVVVTLTTIPTRIETLYYTLYSLLDQTVRVDAIVINIPYVSTKGVPYTIPAWLSELARKNTCIVLNRCEDEGPVTKISHSLRLYRDTTLIIVDDDTVYKSTIIYDLCHASLLYPHCAITGTGYRMFNDDQTNREYHNLVSNMKHVDILMGYNAYLVHTSFFGPDWRTFYKHKLFFYVDDDCISLYLNQHHIPIYAFRYLQGFSLMRWTYLYQWLFSTSDALSKNANRGSGSTLYGKHEAVVLKSYGYYLTDLSFIQFLA